MLVHMHSFHLPVVSLDLPRVSAAIWYFEERNEEQEKISDYEGGRAIRGWKWGDDICWCPWQFIFHTPQIRQTKKGNINNVGIILCG